MVVFPIWEIGLAFRDPVHLLTYRVERGTTWDLFIRLIFHHGHKLLFREEARALSRGI